ncbi:MAG: 50S ribosomal protein L29 [Bradymonadaceae bacterium]
MNPSELRERDDQGLRDLQDELQNELFQLEMQHHTGQLQETSQLKETRRDIARIKTILRERELADEDSNDQ